MSKNRHLAIYPQPQFHDIIFSSKELSPVSNPPILANFRQPLFAYKIIIKQLNLREYTASFRKEWVYSSNLWKKMKRGWQGRVYSDLCDSVLCNSLDSGIICIMIILVEVGFIVKLHYVFLR